MRKIHFTDKYLLSPYHPITVLVAGAGGTGSQVITSLARMSVALQALGHPGLHLTAFDPDTVTEANIGRQLFSETELGLNKATALVTRVNRFFGYAWEARECRYPIITKEGDKSVPLANIIITCTDNTRSRLDLWRFLKKYREYKNNDEKAPIYWMDFGEVSYSTIREEDSGPSCSLAEALRKQDLFINSMLAQIGCDILWRMFREGRTFYRGAYLNLDTLRVNPIPV